MIAFQPLCNPCGGFHKELRLVSSRVSTSTRPNFGLVALGY